MRVLSFVSFIILSESTKRDLPETSGYDHEPPPLIQNNFYPQSLPEPVPFGHIDLAGFGDPYSEHKPPLNPLELDMVIPRNMEEAREMLKKGRQNVEFVRPLPKSFMIPRDTYLREVQQPPPNATKLKWYSLAELQTRNVQIPPEVRARNDKKRENTTPGRMMSSPELVAPKDKYFAKYSFQLNKDVKDDRKVNWTSCNEFAIGAFFSPKEIVNLEWVPFFIWSLSPHRYAIVHKFSFPTSKLVREYRETYAKYLNKTIDWNQPKLFMIGMNEMLLIARDKRGLFDAIPKTEIPDSAKYSKIRLPSISIRLKIEDPYLVMTFCEDHFAILMAIAGTEPTIYREMKAEAATIKFVGTGGPVWRDYEGEKEKLKDIQDRKLAEEEDKFLIIDEPVLPAGYFE